MCRRIVVPVSSECSSTWSQTSLTILWTLVALAAMLSATARGGRAQWFAGMALLGVVTLKLFLIDLANVGSIERIVSFVGVGALMLSSAHKLAVAGADFLICPDNTIHQAMLYVVPRSPLPWLHIAEVVADEAQARGLD